MHKKATTGFKVFFVAGRRLTILVLVGVAAAAWYDSWTIVGLGECGWKMGLSIIFVYVIPTAILRLPLALWIGPMARDKVPDWVVTLPDLVRNFYNKPSGLLAAIVPMASILYCCALLFAVGDVLNLVSGMPLWLAMAISGGIIIVYTALAGMWGLAVTDLIQFMVMTVSAGALVIGIMAHFGGIEVMYAAIEAKDPLLLTAMGHQTWLTAIPWLMSAAALYVNAQSYQRFGAAKTSGDIKVAYSLMLTIGVLFSAAMVIAGMAASVMYPEAESISRGFWATVFSVLPPGARGLFVAALVAAVMSTVSADILLTGGILMKDFYKDCFKPNLSDHEVVKGSQVLIVIQGIFIIVGTYLWKDGIGEAWQIIGGFQLSCFFVPMMGGFFYKKKTAVGGLVSILFGIALYAVWTFALNKPFGIPSPVITWAASAVVYFIVCEATYKGNGNGAKAVAQGG